jgi:hypothetical protein
MEATMRASSESIAELAAAMAKAQSELVNPAKSLTAVIERGRNGHSPISYKYAPLSAGLDILRKTLGKHELAVLQTTHTDDRGMVLLTTTIAHSSGEWISALWPVCRVADICHPKLMGAALTYARRYCLFTMVGLAGEDDLDNPDLDASTLNGEGTSTPSGIEAVAVGPEAEQGGDGIADLDRRADEDISGKHPLAPTEPTRAHDSLAPTAKRKYARKARVPSATLPRSGDPARDLARIEDADALLRWALDILPARNKLGEAQRAEFDAAFLARADAIGADPELLIAFRPSDVPTEFDNGPSPPAT